MIKVVSLKNSKLSLFLLLLLLCINSVYVFASDDANDGEVSLYSDQQSLLQRRQPSPRNIGPREIAQSAVNATYDEFKKITILKNRHERVAAKNNLSLNLLDALLKVSPSTAETQQIRDRIEWENDRIALRSCCCCNSVNHQENCANECFNRTVDFAGKFIIKLK